MKKIFLTLLFILNPFFDVQAEMPELIIRIPSDTIHTLFGLTIEPLGDQNNDGYDDFLAYDTRKKAFLFLGGDPPDSTPSLIFSDVWNRFKNLGDMNSDNFDEFAIASIWPDGQLRIVLHYGGPPLDTVKEIWFGEDTLYGRGYIARGHDINANGTDEIICWNESDLHESLLFYEQGSTPDSIADLILRPINLQPGYHFGDGIITGDFNGDGYRDLCTNLRYPGLALINGMLYLYWGGPAFDTIPDLIIRRPGDFISGYEDFGSQLEYLGDVNNDTYDDFWASSGDAGDTVRRIYFGGPDIDTISDINIVESDPFQQARLAGDLNNDGHSDLITSYSTPFSYGWVRVYCGGPDMDSIADFYFDTGDVPESQYYFGHEVAGIGDFNGDGIDDFAVASYGPGIDQEIFVFSGWDIGTDVPFDYEPSLPNGFQLHQNYPNPFNNSTTISFEIPYKDEISFKIYNILGEEVKDLINKELSAGQYTLMWDGTDSKGQLVSSGIYFYKMSSQSFTQERKMVLVK